MKQGVRFFLRPGTFVNQLQWSSNHAVLLFAFLLIAAIESHVGKHQLLFANYATLLSHRFDLRFDIALWLVVSAKLLAMVIGSFLLSNFIWLVGNIIGHNSSRRVLIRRLAVVFTVALAAYTASHLESIFPWTGTASLFLFVWAGLLCFLALREQFLLSIPETMVMGSVTVLFVMGTWISAHRLFFDYGQKQLNEVAFHKSMKTTIPAPYAKPRSSRR